MKRLATTLLLLFFVAAVGTRLCRRWRDEHRNKTVALVSDWTEVHDLASRTGDTDAMILDALKSLGATGVLLPPMTLDDLLSEGRIVPQTTLGAPSPFDTEQIFFKDPALAELLQKELAWRGIANLQLSKTRSGVLLRRLQGSFDAIKDVEAGFDPTLVALLESKGLVPLLRLNADPWIRSTDVPTILSQDPTLSHARAILFNTDDLPGGIDAMPYWRAWLESASIWIPLFEFHPAKSAAQLSMQLPGQCMKAHTIPSLELKDMTPADVLGRWNRAALERSCRLFLVHASPSDSWPSYLKHVFELQSMLATNGWTVGWPEPTVSWKHPHHALSDLIGLLAFALALMTPWWALQKGKEIGFGSRGFWLTSFWTVLGACGVAALGWNAWTRSEIVPLRGIKAAFLLGWLGSAFVLYRPSELKTLLKAPVRRWDLVLGAIALAVIGYVMIRSGNASAAWKSPIEQKIRDVLERLLIARPRFKEFAIGHPILLIGYLLEHQRRNKTSGWDGRPWILVGMMGQASIVNTFCHMHSPLSMAFLRTSIGLGFGYAIGLAIVIFVLSARKKSRRT